jgi:hypothetical protein
MTPDRAMATAADYAEALITARKAINWLILIVFLILLSQLALFFVGRYTDLLPVASGGPGEPQTLVHTDQLREMASNAEQKIDATLSAKTGTTLPAIDHFQAQDLMYHIVGIADFLGIALGIVLAMVLLLVVKVMLVGRLIGVSRLTSAYIWAIVLLVLLFPWQAFLNNPTFTSSNLRVPGVLYTWEELLLYAKFPNNPIYPAIMHWCRFVVFPAIAVLLVLKIRVLSSRGLRLALGEAEPIVVETA